MGLGQHASLDTCRKSSVDDGCSTTGFKVWLSVFLIVNQVYKKIESGRIVLERFFLFSRLRRHGPHRGPDQRVAEGGNRRKGCGGDGRQHHGHGRKGQSVWFTGHAGYAQPLRG
jgi:hypothetical protein